MADAFFGACFAAGAFDVMGATFVFGAGVLEFFAAAAFFGGVGSEPRTSSATALAARFFVGGIAIDGSADLPVAAAFFGAATLFGAAAFFVVAAGFGSAGLLEALAAMRDVLPTSLTAVGFAAGAFILAGATSADLVAFATGLTPVATADFAPAPFAWLGLVEPS